MYVNNPLSVTVPAHGDSAQLTNSAVKYPENETTWKTTVKHSALLTVIFMRETSGPPTSGPMPHDSVEMTPTQHDKHDHDKSSASESELVCLTYAVVTTTIRV